VVGKTLIHARTHANTQTQNTHTQHTTHTHAHTHQIAAPGHLGVGMDVDKEGQGLIGSNDWGMREEEEFLKKKNDLQR